MYVFLIMRWYEVQSDMRVDRCSAADDAVAATARSAVGGTAVTVTLGPIRNGLDDGTGEEAEGFLTMVSWGKRRDFTPERLSAHIVGFRPLPGTSQVVHRTGMMPLTMVLPELGGREVRGSKRS